MRVIGHHDMWISCEPPTHADIQKLAGEIWEREGKQEDVAKQNWRDAEIMLWLVYAERVRRAVKQEAVSNAHEATPMDGAQNG